MTLPHSYGLALMLTILTMFCWGSWANALKFAKNWRFELLYYDYSIGVALGALVAGLTFGTLGPDGRTFGADLAHAGGINIFYGFLGGVIFNLSNILVVGAISLLSCLLLLAGHQEDVHEQHSGLDLCSGVLVDLRKAYRFARVPFGTFEDGRP